jgi:dihydroxyacetone kinase-like protein
VVGDDVSGQSLRSSGRRGVAGTVILEKILGAAAENGMGLDALKLLGARIAPKIRSMGVAIDGAMLPQTRRATFALGPYEMELGVGIHGEPGRSREPFGDARSIITALCDMVIAELPETDRNSALLFVNGFGATPPAELYLAYGLARAHLKSTGFGIVRSLAGTYVTSLDTDGLSVTVALMDDEMLRLWDQTVRTAILRW